MKKSLSLFAIVTLLFVIAAWISVQQRSPGTMVEKVPLYPELADKIQDVSRVEIKTHDNVTILTARNDQWVLENRGGYPAFFNRIKPLVIALSKLEIREAKTAHAELYSRLQVEDIADEKAKSKQVILQDAEGHILVSLLVGKERTNRTDGSTDSLYVRKAGEQQSYLVKGEVMLSADPADWLENSLIDLSSERLKRISIQHGGDKKVEAIRNEKSAVNYQLKNLPEDFKVRSQTTINSLASVVEELHFDDVNNTAEFKWPDETLTTVYETFDGLVVKVTSAKTSDNNVWAAFQFEFVGQESSDNEKTPNMPSVKQQAELLNTKTSGWVYALPSHKGRQLTRQLADLITEDAGVETEIPKSEKPTEVPANLPPGITPEMLKGMMSPQ